MLTLHLKKGGSIFTHPYINYNIKIPDSISETIINNSHSVTDVTIGLIGTKRCNYPVIFYKEAINL